MSDLVPFGQQRVTGSTVERLVYCPGHLAYPWVRDEGSDAARRGNAYHEYLRACMTKDEPDWDVIGEWRDEVTSLNLDPLFDLRGCPHEVVYQLDVPNMEAHLVGFNLGRAYPECPADWISLTIDVSDPRDYSTRDYKTGKKLGSPTLSPQLLTASLAQHLVYGLPKTKPHPVEYIYIRHRAGREDGGYIQRDQGEVTHEDLMEWGNLLQIAMVQAKLACLSEENRVMYTKPGGHCKWCPAQGCTQRSKT